MIQEILSIATEIICPWSKNSLLISGAAEKSESFSSKHHKLNTECPVQEILQGVVHTNKLKELSAQSKALEAVELEGSVWKRVVQSTPARQMSFSSELAQTHYV